MDSALMAGSKEHSAVQGRLWVEPEGDHCLAILETLSWVVWDFMASSRLIALNTGNRVRWSIVG